MENIILNNKKITRNNDSRTLSIKAEELERLVSGFSYPYNKKDDAPDQEAVENFHLPPMIESFYGVLFERNTLISPDDLFEQYISQPQYFHATSNGKYLVSYNENEKELSRTGIRQRFMRTYPSLLRDFHVYLMAVESGKFDAVHYSTHDDYCKGVDITVTKNGRNYELALLTNTVRANSFREAKKHRHGGANANVLYIGIELSGASKKDCGAFKLYTETAISNAIDSISSSN